MYVHIHVKRMTVLACMFILCIHVCTQAYSCMLAVKLVLTINNWANTLGGKTCPYLLINARSRITKLISRLAAFSTRDLDYYVLTPANMWKTVRYDNVQLWRQTPFCLKYHYCYHFLYAIALAMRNQGSQILFLIMILHLTINVIFHLFCDNGDYLVFDGMTRLGVNWILTAPYHQESWYLQCKLESNISSVRKVCNSSLLIQILTLA